MAQLCITLSYASPPLLTQVVRHNFKPGARRARHAVPKVTVHFGKRYCRWLILKKCCFPFLALPMASLLTLPMASRSRSGNSSEPKPKRQQQLKKLIVDGIAVCRQCKAPLTGRFVFCDDKVPKCTQAYHREQGLNSAFAEGVRHQAEKQQPGELLAPGEQLADEDAETQRVASSGWEDLSQHAEFNLQVLEREVDGWQKTTLTLPISMRLSAALLQPFLTVSRLPRTDDNIFNHVLLPSGQPWTTTFKAGRGRRIKFVLAGFDSYSATQHAGTVTERDIAQRSNIVMFLPWIAWVETFPLEVLPAGFSDSATWAAKVQDVLLQAVKVLFSKNSLHWDESWEILYIHVLDQMVGAARFRMHRDIEEDSNKFGEGNRLRVQHTMVLLLEKGDKKVPGLFVAGAEKCATYPGPMSGHVFKAMLWHSTQPMRDGRCSGVKLGVFIGNRF